ncbi:MAG: glycine cleavage system aminomethyltransferase GcvT [Planctomycetes bacterium]|nr:glycine cleavage system aminomethyltransferase GcvT [Planctomycetota bacterium]
MERPASHEIPGSVGIVNQSPLHDVHTKLGATLVDFAGWRMPLTYGSIIAEHNRTRTGCTVFDVSHMGRIRVEGADAESLLQRLCTRNVAEMEPGQARYTHMCNESGGILDDMLVYRSESHWDVVCNASNRTKIVDWMNEHARSIQASIDDRTLQTAMLAVQGPRTMDYAQRLLPFDLGHLKRYRFRSGIAMGIAYTVARSGYTGEDGLEIIVPAGVVKMVTSSIFNMESNGEKAITPAGLGARDSLRLEAGMPLYGHELNEDVDPLTAGQGWCVDLGKDFIGVEAMRKLQADGLKRKLVGLELSGRRMARQGYPVLVSGRTIGQVTSGTLSPTLGKSIAMAFVQAEHAELGTELTVDLRGRPTEAAVVKLPFYKRSKN